MAEDCEAADTREHAIYWKMANSLTPPRHTRDFPCLEKQKIQVSGCNMHSRVQINTQHSQKNAPTVTYHYLHVA